MSDYDELKSALSKDSIVKIPVAYSEVIIEPSNQIKDIQYLSKLEEKAKTIASKHDNIFLKLLMSKDQKQEVEKINNTILKLHHEHLKKSLNDFYVAQQEINRAILYQMFQDFCIKLEIKRTNEINSLLKHYEELVYEYIEAHKQKLYAKFNNLKEDSPFYESEKRNIIAEFDKKLNFKDSIEEIFHNRISSMFMGFKVNNHIS